MKPPTSEVECPNRLLRETLMGESGETNVKKSIFDFFGA